MNLYNYNNIGIAYIAIHSTLQHSQEISLAKALLIMPIITHKELTSYLARKDTKVKSIEHLISEKTLFFSNFSKRYYDSLNLSINAISLLIESNVISIHDGEIKANADFVYNSIMGKRAKRIHNASKNISNILNESADKLYLNLRVEL